ncbi:MAG: signal peptidase I [Clostridia bacterium]|nr:signal peptidase I [Clostridia bacterium]
MNKTTKKRILNITTSVLTGMVFLLVIFLFTALLLASFSGEKNGKEIFGVKILIVRSDSMKKSEISQDEKIFFESGDLILIKKVNPETLQEGDVISFVSYNSDSYGKTLTHKIRTVAYDEDGEVVGFETYGINTGKSDSATVRPDTVIGKYQRKIPNVGTFFAFLKTTKGYFVSVLLPFVVVVAFIFLQIGKILGQKSAEKEYARKLSAQQEKEDNQE